MPSKRKRTTLTYETSNHDERPERTRYEALPLLDLLALFWCDCFRGRVLDVVVPWREGRLLC